MQTTTIAPLTTEPTLSKDRNKGEDKQITFRLSGALHKRLEKAAAGLELDLSSLLRMMIREQLPIYEERAEEIARREQGDDTPSPQPEA